MKKLFALGLLLVLGFSHWAKAGQNANSLFAKGNKFYADGVFDSATVTYEKIATLGFESPELFFNLGNSYFKLSNYPKAIVNYERALLLKPGDETIEHNLAKARYYNIDTLDEIPQFVLRRWINSVIILFHSNIWAVISIIGFISALIFLIVYFNSMRIGAKRIAFYMALAFMFISAGTFYLSYKSKQLVIQSNGAIVMSSTVTVKSSPRESGTELFIIHEGTKVFILNSLDDWYEIRLSDGKQGWLQKNKVEVI